VFVCEQDYGKTAALIFTKFGGKVAHGARKERLDVGDNPDYVIGVRVTVKLEYIRLGFRLCRELAQYPWKKPLDLAG